MSAQNVFSGLVFRARGFAFYSEAGHNTEKHKIPYTRISLSNKINIWGLSPSLLEFTIWIDSLGEVD